MANPVLMLGNPRRRKARKHRKVRRSRRRSYPMTLSRSSFAMNPRRRYRRRRAVRLHRNPRASGIVNMLVGKVLPLAGGFTLGLVAPKLPIWGGMNENLKLAIVAGVGIIGPALLGRVIGRSMATLICIGITSSVAAQFINKLIVAKTSVGSVLSDSSEVELMDDSEGDYQEISAEGDPSLQAEVDPSMRDEDDGSEY